MENEVIWYETDATLPPIGEVVLGCWTPTVLSTVVRRNAVDWCAPGYYYAEFRRRPPYWSPLPEAPL